MSELKTNDFIRYLSAKKTVDDRALNKAVWERLKREVHSRSSREPLNVLEIGAGIGTMIERVLEWGLLGSANYLALDAMAENIEEAAARVPAIAADLGFQVERAQEGYRFEKGATRMALSLKATDVFDFIAEQPRRPGWDLLIANAFLDLVDVPKALPRMLSLLKPGGLFYFTITFDGATILEPQLDQDLDARIEALYHETMDKRIVRGQQSGDSRTGRHFFQHVRSIGAQLLDAGSSDWVVFGGPEGYEADEAFFLHFIIDTMALALEITQKLDSRALQGWARRRHQQIEEGTLVYIAHQMDFLGQVP